MDVVVAIRRSCLRCYGARIHSCYEGWITYLHNDTDGDYHPGDLWGCVGWHWSGHWKDPGAQRYINHVHHYLDTQPWRNESNQNRRPVSHPQRPTTSIPGSGGSAPVVAQQMRARIKSRGPAAG